ncbi:hypothetical protein VPH35_090978 [Triticum aestivum]
MTHRFICYLKHNQSGNITIPYGQLYDVSAKKSAIPRTLIPATQEGWNAASSVSKRDSPPCRPDVSSHGSKGARHLDSDIWCRIYSLLQMQDAARAACVSRSSLGYWRCHPNLTFTNEKMCPKENLDYNNKIDCVLRNRSCADAVTKLKLDYHVPPDGAESYHRLDSWLQMAVTPRTEELELLVSWKEARFKFPCTLLPPRCGDSIQKLFLFRCALRLTFQLALRSLKTLHLRDVRVTGEDLGRLLSGSTALEHLKLVYCDDIVRLEIPCLLQRLSFLEVAGCMKLQRVNAPMAASSKFLHLKFLSILLINRWNFHRDYDYLSLVPFLDASPFLETFRLYVCEQSMWMYDWFEGDPSSLRRMPQHCHGNLKSVKIIGFFPQKSMVELACHLLENTTSHESLTVDTSPATYRCSVSKPARKCCPLEVSAIVKAHRFSRRRLPLPRNVPSTVKLNVPEPCGRCHRLKKSDAKSV